MIALSRKKYLPNSVQEVFNKLFKLCSQLIRGILCSEYLQLTARLTHGVLFRAFLPLIRQKQIHHTAVALYAILLAVSL